MKRGIIAILIAVAFTTTALVGTIWAQKTASGEVSDDIELYSDVFKKKKKGPVILTHKKHSVDYKLKCTDCHHVYKDGKNVFKEGDKVQKCDECHTSAKKDKGKTLSLYKAFHKNCRDCHKAAKKKTAPTKCNGCHQKKKK